MSQDYNPIHLKYRPQRFIDLIGQNAIAATLTQAIRTNRIAPAYIFCGPRGTGKTSSARILAKSLNCLSSQTPTTDPCGSCELCIDIAGGSALDVIEIDAASNTGVDNIRELIERSRFVPVQARWKVYVIDECHMLSNAAFNALLKTLEEPPKNVVFVLATTDPQRVLPTVLSRCQRFEFRRIDNQSMKDHLNMIANKEKILIEDDALDFITQHAEGGLRDAESLLDQLSLLQKTIKIENIWDLLGVIPDQELINIIDALKSENPINLLETTRRLLNQGRDSKSILQGITSALRDLVLIKVAPERIDLTTISKQFRGKLCEFCKDLDLQMLLNWQSKLKGSESILRNSIHPRLWLEVVLLDLLTVSNQEKIDAPRSEKIATQEKKPIQNSTTEKSLNETIPIKRQDIETTESKLKNKDLSQLWEKILNNLELPSTRMLLSQQAHLVRLDEKTAAIEVASNWLGMVESRKSLLEEAIQISLSGKRELLIEEKNLKSIEKEKQESKNIVSHSMVAKEDVLNRIKEEKTSSTEISNNPAQNKQGNNKQLIDGKAENLANFFNGEVLDLDVES